MSSHRRAWLLLLCQSCYISAGQAPVCSETKTPKIVVAGSLNVDITMEVPRLPRQDETIMASSPVMRTALGGKGANQAVAAARLGAGVSFVGRFGSDAHASWLAQVLRSNGVDISGSSHSQLGSGQGIVMLDSSGSASSVVVGGSNTDWPALSQSERSRLLQGAAAVLLQREIPEEVNIAFAQAAKAAGARVFLDAGGQDAPISDSLLRLVDVFCPNESELQRLTGLSTSTRAEVVTAAKALRARGAAAVLVTLGARGALLVAEGQELDTPALAVPGGRVVDATAAGDAFRAAMAVALAEGQGWSDALRLAAAAGAIAVATAGAEPSLPNRSACDALAFGTTPRSVAEGQCNVAAEVPDQLRFASRLNSMKARPELWAGSTDTLGLLQRQSRVRGLDMVYFNFPQHLEGLSPEAVRAALAAAGLSAGGVALRYPDSFRLGGFTNPDPAYRELAVNLTVESCRWAQELNADEVVVWPQTDGYDYSFQVDYPLLWSRSLAAFRAVLDHPLCRPLKVSIEFKPTDEISRFAAVPSTAAALLFVAQVDRPNFGVTLV
eukprot:s1054_g4.t1